MTVASIQSQAAIQIQRHYRRHLARNPDLLSYSLLNRVKSLIGDQERLLSLPRALDGRTPVFFPPNVPVVIKVSGVPGNAERFEKMKQARQIARDNDCHHLVIPRALVYRDVIVEGRLPLHGSDTKAILGLYFENQPAFSEAVREFTKWLLKADLKSILTGKREAYCCLSPIKKVARYDNIALYLENGVGKIGLVDLERFSIRASDKEIPVDMICATLLLCFPLHKETILNVIQERFDYDPSYLQWLEQGLEPVEEAALVLLKRAYLDHRAFCMSHEISLQEPSKPVSISEERKEEANERVMVALQRKGYSAEIAIAENAFPKICDDVVQFLSEELKRDEMTVSSMDQLLCHRTLYFSIYILKQRCAALLNAQCPRSFPADFVDAILDELKRGGEIADYHKQFSSSPRDKETRCVFC